MKTGMIYLRLTFVAIFWGLSFNAGQLAVEIMSPLTVTAWRFIIATIIMVSLLWIKEPPTKKLLKMNWKMYVMLGVVGVFVTNSFQFYALKFTSPLHPSLIMATNPMVTAIFAFFLLQERLRLAQLLGMVLSIVGVVYVITNGSFLSTFQSVNLGDLLAMGANITWALYAVLGRKFLKDSSSLATTTYTMAVATLCLLPFVSLQHAAVSSQTLWIGWGAIAFMGTCGAVLTFLWWNQGVATIGASKTSVFFNLVPVVTLLASVAMGQHIGITQVIGTGLVIIGVFISSMNRSSMA
ncbi:DMT family transporter [Shimazuella sp. AN120528]|uniref:DMT family transporter n=1 Tax=Shimazuella soli TaxID=1892854 RepID=UPI001F0EB211|nr:DMT family transporter [Shimazuella soli]MCH5586411.1 DMT family transporter [Shimazuella soli]